MFRVQRLRFTDCLGTANSYSKDHPPSNGPSEENDREIAPDQVTIRSNGPNVTSSTLQLISIIHIAIISLGTNIAAPSYRSTGRSDQEACKSLCIITQRRRRCAMNADCGHHQPCS